MRTWTNLLVLGAGLGLTYGLIMLTHIVLPFLALPWIIGFAQGGLYQRASSGSTD